MPVHCDLHEMTEWSRGCSAMAITVIYLVVRGYQHDHICFLYVLCMLLMYFTHILLRQNETFHPSPCITNMINITMKPTALSSASWPLSNEQISICLAPLSLKLTYYVIYSPHDWQHQQWGSAGNEYVIYLPVQLCGPAGDKEVTSTKTNSSNNVILVDILKLDCSKAGRMVKTLVLVGWRYFWHRAIFIIDMVTYLTYFGLVDGNLSAGWKQLIACC